MGRDWDREKDKLHQRRKELAEQMRPGMMSVSQMKRGTDGIMSHEEQVEKYDKWKSQNQGNMQEWSQINRKFKENGEEGRMHSLDDIRKEGRMIYD
jgi:hypothetical protein